MSSFFSSYVFSRRKAERRVCGLQELGQGMHGIEALLESLLVRLHVQIFVASLVEVGGVLCTEGFGRAARTRPAAKSYWSKLMEGCMAPER
jgi:hypothetical protein